MALYNEETGNHDYDCYCGTSACSTSFDCKHGLYHRHCTLCLGTATVTINPSHPMSRGEHIAYKIRVDRTRVAVGTPPTGGDDIKAGASWSLLEEWRQLHDDWGTRDDVMDQYRVQQWSYEPDRRVRFNKDYFLGYYRNWLDSTIGFAVDPGFTIIDPEEVAPSK